MNSYISVPLPNGVPSIVFGPYSGNEALKFLDANPINDAFVTFSDVCAGSDTTYGGASDIFAITRRLSGG